MCVCMCLSVCAMACVYVWLFYFACNIPVNSAVKLSGYKVMSALLLSCSLKIFPVMLLVDCLWFLHGENDSLALLSWIIFR
jgi:hypothetical protein